MAQSESAQRQRSMVGTQIPGSETLVCERCRGRTKNSRRSKDERPCGGVWRFHSQHEKYILQCWRCREDKQLCSFRNFENDGGPRTRSGRQKGAGEKRQRSVSVISISDSEEENQVPGPSSRPKKKVKVENEETWDQLKQTLLTARKEKVEIETEAEINSARRLARRLARVNVIIEGAEEAVRKLKEGE